MLRPHPTSLFFFFNDTATTEIYTLSLHDALPIYFIALLKFGDAGTHCLDNTGNVPARNKWRSEEHTSELQSRLHLVCRLLLEKKKKKYKKIPLNPHTLQILTQPSTHDTAYTLTES